MAKPAVDFEVLDDELRLIYRPRDDTSWVHDRFARGDELLVKGTFHLTRLDLVEDAAEEAANANEIPLCEVERAFYQKLVPAREPIVHPTGVVAWAVDKTELVIECFEFNSGLGHG